MKKIFTPALSFILLSTSLFAQQIPNASFEDWKFNFVLETDMPVSWRGEFQYGQEDQPALKTEDGVDGDFCIKVQQPTFRDLANGVYTKIAYSEFASNALTGYYKSTIVKGDSARVSVKYMLGKKEVKTQSSFYIKSSQTEWTFFQFKIAKTQNADSIMIELASSTTDTSSVIWIDNISFGTFVDVNETPTVDEEFSLYPNPTSEFVNIALSENFLADESTQIKVIDITGKVVMSFGRNQKTINTSALQAGIYLVEVRSKNSFAVQNLQIK